MDPLHRGHATSDSFRREYTTRPPGFRTPPPPSHVVEPLSPVFAYSTLPRSRSPDFKRRRYQEPDNYRARWQRPTNKVSKDSDRKLAPAALPPLSTPTHPHPTPYYRSQLSPTALDVFAAVATSPDLAQTGSSLWSSPPPAGLSAPRGSKRARSEAVNLRPQHHDMSRPSTSYASTSLIPRKHSAALNHVSASHRSHSAQYHGPANGALPETTISDAQLEEAELLLGFARGATYRSSHVAHYSNHAARPSVKVEAQRPPVNPWSGPSSDAQSPWSLPLESRRTDSSPPKVYGSHSTSVNGNLPGGPRTTDDYGASSLGRSSTSTSGAMHSWPVKETQQDPPKKPRIHKGWPKGKPRGKRTTTTTNATQTKKGTGKRATKAEKIQQAQASQQKKLPMASVLSALEDFSLPKRPKSIAGDEFMSTQSRPQPSTPPRASSVPPNILMVGPLKKPLKTKSEVKLSLCALCQQTESPNDYHELWITCNGCREWFHTICAGFKTEREVRDVDKFYCPSCEQKHGKTTFVRKSSRAHASVDYAGLNEGEIRTSSDTFEHHFIQPIKDGTFQFLPEKFPRMQPELVTAAFFERSGTISEPVLIPASMNPRPGMPGEEVAPVPTPEADNHAVPPSLVDGHEYDCVPDDGQDKLDMVMPQGLSVRHVAELLGPDRPLQVIDVKSQDQGDTTWTLRKWADYYEMPGEKPVRNVISLEVSQTKLSRLIRRPKIVRDLDLQDQVWPQEELDKGTYPPVQFYCLMSVADCYTDFHIDFGGSSVYYHILRGKKTFFFIPPKKQHLKKYEEWCVSPNQASVFLGNVTKECYRVDLSEGDTMLIPSGWIHAVWTPENSLVIGGNFLTRMHYGMQIQINEIEKNTGVARMFRYPHFQKIQWYTVIQYLQKDPVPFTVAQILYDGGKFHREFPVYFDFATSLQSEEAPSDYFNARYYSQGEIEGLADLLSFVFRTVMISLGLIPLAKGKQDAVVRSLPKGYGDHLDLLKTFALWVAWKRGNEELPIWAHPEAPLSELEAAITEKKAPVVISKRAERESNRKVTTPERRSQRQTPRGKDTEAPAQVTLQAVEQDTNRAANEPNQGTGRIWCEACRRSRVRCKHREPGDQLDSTERFGIKGVKVLPQPEPYYPAINSIPAGDMTLIHDSAQPSVSQSSQMVKGQDSELESGRQTPVLSTAVNGAQQTAGAQVRIKACEECRKSKRRCIHDAEGNIDPVKALQNPVQRAFYATKRMRHDRSVNGAPPAKKAKINPVDGGLATAENDAADSGSTAPDFSVKQPDTHEPPDVEPPLTTTHDAHVINGAEDGAGQGASASIESNFVQQHGDSEISYSDQNRDIVNAGNYSGDEQLVPSKDDTASANVDSITNGVASETKLLEDAGANNDTAANQSLSENRSRTPSLHVQTNSTESLDRSRSPPTSPLTDMEPSSPVIPKQEEQVENALQDGVASPLPPAQPKGQAQMSAPQSVDTKALRTPLIQSGKARSKSATKSSKKSTPKRRSTTSRSVSMEVGNLGPNGTPARGMSAKSQAVSPSEETPEDESMRLARQLQEQEFGLRRRSK